jgi:hypothetical protein
MENLLGLGANLPKLLDWRMGVAGVSALGIAHIAGKIAGAAYTAEMLEPATKVINILRDPLIAEIVLVAQAYSRCNQNAYVDATHALDAFLSEALNTLEKPPPMYSRHLPLVHCRQKVTAMQQNFKLLLKRAGSPRDLEEALVDLDTTCSDTLSNLRLHLN